MEVGAPFVKGFAEDCEEVCAARARGGGVAGERLLAEPGDGVAEKGKGPEVEERERG